MATDKQQPPNLELPVERGGSERVQASRRRFVKHSSLALPAIVTLGSGLPAAAQSATCGDKALTTSTGAPGGGNPGDPLNYNGRFTLNESDGDVNRAPTTIYEDVSTPGTFRYYVDSVISGSNPTVYRDISNGTIVSDTLVNTLGPTESRFAVVYYDHETGLPTAMGYPDSTGLVQQIWTSAAGACLNSLRQM